MASSAVTPKEKRRTIKITLSVTLSDDSFQSALTFPVDVSKEKIQAMFLGWMTALNTAISADNQEVPNVQE